MPNSNCWACEVNIGRLAYPKGTLGWGLGTCRMCNSLACGHHGHRDDNGPEYMCVQCDTKLLIASAVHLSGGVSDSIPSIVVQAASGYRPLPEGGDIWIIRSLDELEIRRPGYGRDILGLMRRVRIRPIRFTEHSELLIFLDELPEEAKELIIAAVIITRTFEMQITEFVNILSEYIVERS